MHKSQFLGIAFLLCVSTVAHGASPNAETPQLGDPPIVVDTSDQSSAPAGIVSTKAAASTFLDITNRDGVIGFFHSVYVIASPPAMDFTGDVSACAAGTTSQAYKQEVARRINFFRAMAGVPASVVLSDTLSARAQAAALIMSANAQLSHTPPASWICYSAQGADAASHSNLALGSSGWGAIDNYMFEFGAHNSAVGHRRWLLYPPTTEMGSGDMPGFTGYWQANTLWVINSGSNSPRPPTRDPFVTWPPPGYVPYRFVYPRWSFSYPGADFANASIDMWHNGIAISVVVEPLAPIIGYKGDNTIVWRPQDMADNTKWPRPASALPEDDTVYTITVANVSVNGVAQSFTYSVTVVDVNLPPTAFDVIPRFVPENQPIGSPVASFTRPIDPDAPQEAFSFALVAGEGDTDNEDFEVVDNQLRTRQILDHEAQSILTVRLQVMDSRGLTYTQSLTLTVLDASDPPTGILPASASVAENAPPGQWVATLSTLDQDAIDTHIYSLLPGGAVATFVITNNQLFARTALDFEVRPALTVNVRSTDASGWSVARTLTISVTNINESPFFINAPRHVLARAGVPIQLAVAFDDPDVQDMVAANAMKLPTWLTVTQSTSRTVSLTGIPTNMDVGVTSVVLRLSDLGGLSDEAAFDIDVRASYKLLLPVVEH